MAQKIGEGYIEIEGRPDKSQIRKAAEESGKLGGGRFGGVFGKVAAVALKGALGVALTALAAQAGSLVIQLLGIIPALSSIASLSAVIPAGIIAGVAAIGVFKAALSGVGDAMKAAFGDDPAKFAEALKKLSPEARKFALALRETVKPLKEVQQSIQDAFFSTGLVQEIGKINNIVTGLKGNLTPLAGAFGNIAAQAINFTAQAQTMNVIRDVIDALTSGVGTFAANFGKLAAGFRDVTAVALPLFESMTVGIGSAAGRFGAWMSEISASGQLQQWIQTALSTLATLGQILGNVGSIIMSVLQAAESVGGGALNVFAELTGTVAAFLSSAEGMSGLQSLFAGIMAVAQALMPVLTTLAGVLLSALGPAIQQIAEILGPVLLQAVQAVAPAIGPLVQALVSIIAAIAPILPIVGQLAAQLGGILAQALTTLAPTLGSILELFARLAGPVLTLLGTVLNVLLTALTPVIDALVGALMPILPQIVNMFTMLITAVSPLVTLIGQFLAQAIAQLLPPILQLIPLIISQLMPAFISLMPAIMSIVQALFPLIPILAELIVSLMPIISLLVQLQATILSQLIPAIAPLIVIVIQLATTILGALLPAILPVITTFVKLATTLLGTVIGALASLINGGIRPVISAIASFIGKLAEVIAAIIKFATNAVKKFFEVRQAVINAFKAAGTWLLDAGKKIIQGLINGITNKIGDLKKKMSEAANVAKSFWPFSPAKEGPLSGSGNPFYAGQSIMELIAEGIKSKQDVLGVASANAATPFTPRPLVDSVAGGQDTARQVVVQVGGVQITVTGVDLSDARSIGEDVADGLLQRLADASLVR